MPLSLKGTPLTSAKKKHPTMEKNMSTWISRSSGKYGLMTEYTPTTADIMECYKGQLIQTGEHSYELIDEERAIAEFGRWIKAERTRVAEIAIDREREKIVKMFAKFADTDGYVNMKVSDITKLVGGDNDTYNQELLNDFSWR
jgi:hypothetical protein